jgi:hypothetical protein
MEEFQLAMWLVNLLLVAALIVFIILPPVAIGICTTVIVSKFYELPFFVKAILCFAVTVASYFVWNPIGKAIVGLIFFR